jgi:hypothetical protein
MTLGVVVSLYNIVITRTTKGDFWHTRALEGRDLYSGIPSFRKSVLPLGKHRSTEVEERVYSAARITNENDQCRRQV